MSDKVLAWPGHKLTWMETQGFIYGSKLTALGKQTGEYHDIDQNWICLMIQFSNIQELRNKIQFKNINCNLLHTWCQLSGSEQV